MPARRPVSRCRRNRLSETRGAVLIVALLLAALIAIGLASYLNLNLSSARLSKRTFNSYAAFNLAEAGAEEAVWAFNRALGGEPAWDPWTKGHITAAWQKFSGFDFGRNTTGWVKVYVDNHDPGPTAKPKVLTQSSIGAPGDTPVSRMLEVTLRRRSLFAGGLVAAEKIVFSGTNATVDAWDSDPDRDPATAPIPYDPTVRTDRGTVASKMTLAGSILINRASIWGYVATRGAPPEVGVGGSIRGSTTPAGLAVDPTRITTDFNADLPPVPAPADGTPLAVPIPAVLGTDGTKTRWRAHSLTLSGTSTLTIRGDVTLILTAAAGIDAISVTGNASIIIPLGSTFTVFVEGNVRIAGNGVANANTQPLTFRLFGTNDSPGGQDIRIAGNGVLKSAIYAPSGDVEVNGNGEVMGAIVGRSIHLTGNAAFHYDESLAEGQDDQPFTISRWRELNSAAERQPYEALFQGW